MPREPAEDLDDFDDKELLNGNEGEEDGLEEDGLEEDGGRNVQSKGPQGQDDEEGDEGPDGLEPQSRSGRKSFGDIRREAREAREDAAKLRREMEELKTATQQRQSAPDPELERQRLELMTPEERLEYKLNRANEANQRQIQMMQFQMADQMDRTNYRAVARSNPVYAKYEGEVEAKRQELLRKNTAVDRETILKYIIGEKMLASGGKGGDKQRRAAQDRVNRQRVPAANGKGDVASDRRSGGRTLENRLEGVEL